MIERIKEKIRKYDYNSTMKKAEKDTDSFYIQCLMELMLGLQIKEVERFIAYSTPTDYRRLGTAYYNASIKTKEQEND